MDKEEFFAEARDDLTGPLAGICVLEVGTTWAGPLCGSVLGDLGADVIKVEIPTEGDIARSILPLPDTELSLMHATVNRNKRSLAIDITSDEGRQIMLDVITSTDIMVENFRAGALARHGLGYADVRKVKRDIVYVSVTGWGQFGPDHDAAGYDPMAQATSGFMTLNGPPDSDPTRAGTYLSDDLAGLHAVIGAMAALRHRDQTGEGQHVDVALLDATISQTNGFPTLGAIGLTPEKFGNQYGSLAPCNIYACSDGPVYAGVLLDTHWKVLAELIGQPELADHESFATRDARVVNRDLCDLYLASWLAERTRDEAISALRSNGLPAARVQTMTEVAQDPHVLERDMLQPTKHYDGTTIPIVGPAAKFSRTPTRIRAGAPALGQHNDEILTDLHVTVAQPSSKA